MPFDLPPTTGPCPHCGTSVTSPAPPVSGFPGVDAPAAPAPGTSQALPEPRQEAASASPVPPAPPLPSVLPGGIDPSGPPSHTPTIGGAVSSIPLPETADNGLPGGAPTTIPAPTSETAAPPVAPTSLPVPDEANRSKEAGPALEEALAPDEDIAPKRRRVHPAIPFLVAILLIVGVLVALIVINRKDPDPGPPIVASKPAVPKEDSEDRMRFLRDGWKEQASGALAGFLQAETVEEKARYVLGGADRIEEMRAFYDGAARIDDSDTPLDVFSHLDLDISDKKRGLFLMQYERPAQFDMRELFRPVAPLEVQHNLEEPGLLLSAFSARENFAMESMRVMAFFKEVDGTLLLDWDVFAQTKYRTFQHFVNHPNSGNSKVFRVMVREEMPASTAVDVTKYRFYRFSDPAHAGDYLQVPVAVDSAVGRVLSDLAWVNIPGKQAQDRYATVELAWSNESDPRVYLRNVICWEFLGLGGVEGNADVVGEPAEPAGEPEPDTTPPAPEPPTVGSEAVSLPAESEGASPAPAEVDHESPDGGEGVPSELGTPQAP